MDRCRAVAQWLDEHSEKKDVVVLSSLNTLPEFIYHNKKNIVFGAIDYQLIHDAFPELAVQYLKLVTATHSDPLNFFKQIDGKFFLYDIMYHNEKVLDNMFMHPGLQMVYSDNDFIVFEIKEELLAS